MKEAQTLLREAQARDLFFAINFNHRYAKPVQMAKTAIDDGRLGELVFATWRFGGEGEGQHPHANLIETQCHGFDMLEAFGRRDRVSSSGDDRYHGQRIQHNGVIA